MDIGIENDIFHLEMCHIHIPLVSFIIHVYFTLCLANDEWNMGVIQGALGISFIVLSPLHPPT